MGEKMTGDQGGLTRRQMLKRTAIVGAVAWSAPIISTFNTPAFGQETVSPADCPEWNCGDPIVGCGQAVGEPPLSSVCICDKDVEGNPFCWNDFYCSDSIACTQNSDCPPGWACTTNCCGTYCAPPCGVSAGVSAVKADVTTSDTRTAAGL